MGWGLITPIPTIMKCFDCYNEIEIEGQYYCILCRLKHAEQWRNVPPAPSLIRMSDGPGSGNNEMIFDRPDVAKEMEITFRGMEAQGKFANDPARAATAKRLLEEAKSKIKVDIDYQKGWHPLDQNPQAKVERE